MVGPRMAAPHAAGAGGTVVSTAGGVVGAGVVGAGVTDDGSCATGTLVVAESVVTVVGAVADGAMVMVDESLPAAIGGPAAASSPSVGRSSAANNAPLAPMRVRAGTTRRANVSPFFAPLLVFAGTTGRFGGSFEFIGFTTRNVRNGYGSWAHRPLSSPRERRAEDDRGRT